MREIKFRIWSKHTNSWCEYDFCLANDGKVATFTSGVYNLQDNFVTQQFTGLKDKNGVEIYEGDIVREQNKFGETFSIVEFNSASFAVRYLKGAAQRNLVGFFNDCNGPISEHLEVVGNIFENSIDK